MQKFVCNRVAYWSKGAPPGAFFSIYNAYGIVESMTRAKTKTPRPRTYARNRAAAISRSGRLLIAESDSTYFLKLIVVVILGTLWIKLSTPLSWQGMSFGALPLGLVVGLIGIKLLEKNPFDRKIWFAVLIIIAVISYFVPAGIVI